MARVLFKCLAGAALVPALVALAIGLALTWSFRAVDRIAEERQRARQVANGVHQLDVLAHDYIAHHEEQHSRQFRRVHGELVVLLSAAIPAVLCRDLFLVTHGKPAGPRVGKLRPE